MNIATWTYKVCSRAMTDVMMGDARPRGFCMVDSKSQTFRRCGSAVSLASYVHVVNRICLTHSPSPARFPCRDAVEAMESRIPGGLIGS